MRENHSGGLEIMQPEDSKDPDEEVNDPFHGEVRLRILDIQERRPVGHEIQCISEPSLYLLRARVSNIDGISVGETIEISAESIGSLSEVRLKDLSGTSQQLFSVPFFYSPHRMFPAFLAPLLFDKFIFHFGNFYLRQIWLS